MSLKLAELSLCNLKSMQFPYVSHRIHHSGYTAFHILLQWL